MLTHFGAAPSDLEALLAYTANPFDPTPPLVAEDEPHVAEWARYAGAARHEGGARVLTRALPQLRFPVREGVADSPDYRRATRRGEVPDAAVCPPPFHGDVQIRLQEGPAGTLPVAVFADRRDFVRTVRSVVHRNAPVAVAPTMGALLVSGYNNWNRIRRYRARWVAGGGKPSEWPQEFAALREQPELYQDRFALVSSGPYGSVPAADLDLADEAWARTSVDLRTCHEAAHYYCRRVLGTMRTNLLDEWVADATAVVQVGAPEPARWLTTFLTHPQRGRARSYTASLTEGQHEVVRRVLASLIRRTDWSALAAPASRDDTARLIRRFASGSLEEQWLACGAASG